MKFKLLFILTFLCFICCDISENDDSTNSTFLEIHNETMWQSTEEFYEDTYIGFSNNIEVAMIYSAIVNSENSYCIKYKEGENIIAGSECNWESGETTQTYTIVENSKNLLILDFNYYDDSCDTPFSIDYRYSYSVDGDFLYETIEQIGQESQFNEYSKTTFTYEELCIKE